MKLMEKVQNWFRKNDEAVLPVSTEPVEKEPAPDQEKKESPEEIIRKNREKASKIAMEIDILRGRLPMMMNYASIEKIREVNDVLEETEAALKGVKVATAEREYRNASLPVGKVVEKLPAESFVEIHKSDFVRMEEIRRIGTDAVIMSNNASLPLSRRKRKEVMGKVLKTMKGKMS